MAPAINCPATAYRRVALDAAVHGADERGLARLCFEALDNALAAALRYGDAGDMPGTRRFLARAADALAALRGSLAQGHPLAAAFDGLIGSAHRSFMNCMAVFDAGRLQMIRRDFQDIGDALEASAA